MNIKLRDALFTVVLCGVSAAAPAGNPDKGLVYDSTRPLLVLHLTPVRQHALTELDLLLGAVTAGSTVTNQKAVVVYVHGRGNEPRKSFTDTTFTKGSLLQKVEAYGVGAIGFNWNSKIRPLHFCDRPVDQAVNAAPDFVRLVGDLKSHKATHPDFWKERPLILFVHSMGSYVIKAAAESTDLPTSKVFDRIVVTSSDAPLEGHPSWLNKPAWGEERLVFVNPADKILAKSLNCESKSLKKAIKSENKRRNKAKQELLPIVTAPPRLGLLGMPVAVDTLSASAIYLSVPSFERHRYFTLGGQAFNPDVCTVFRAALSGKEVKLQSSWQKDDVANQYVIPVSTKKDDSCFGTVTEDSDDD